MKITASLGSSSLSRFLSLSDAQPDTRYVGFKVTVIDLERHDRQQSLFRSRFRFITARSRRDDRRKASKRASRQAFNRIRHTDRGLLSDQLRLVDGRFRSTTSAFATPAMPRASDSCGRIVSRVLTPTL